MAGIVSTKSSADPAVDPSVERVLAILSHELRAPLAAITVAIAVQKRALAPERRQRATEVIEHQVRHMSALVDNIGDAVEIGRSLTLNVQRLDIRGALRDALDATAPAFQLKRHELTLTQAAVPLWVAGDETRLTQVFSNLLRNAAAYTPEHGRIDVSLALHDGQVQFRIADNGLGIQPEWLDKIFNLFERGPHGVSRGSGIGLGLVRALVQLHGGTVRARSDGPGRGSEFIVTLPPA